MCSPRSGSTLDGARRQKSGPLWIAYVDLRITRNYAETQAPVMRAQFRRRQRNCVKWSSYGAVVAQLAERLPSKQGVAGSNPVRRSRPNVLSVCALAPGTATWALLRATPVRRCLLQPIRPMPPAVDW